LTTETRARFGRRRSVVGGATSATRDRRRASGTLTERARGRSLGRVDASSLARVVVGVADADADADAREASIVGGGVGVGGGLSRARMSTTIDRSIDRARLEATTDDETRVVSRCLGETTGRMGGKRRNNARVRFRGDGARRSRSSRGRCYLARDVVDVVVVI